MAFNQCLSLERIKIPSSVNVIGEYAFNTCSVLVEAILTASSITEIPELGFAYCRSLQTVGLPNSLERICDGAFEHCSRLVTVIVPLNSKPIKIGDASFSGCRVLANLVLPQGSIATRTSFDMYVDIHFEEACGLLQDRFGVGADSIVAGLVGRFANFPVHNLCYDHSSTTAQELRFSIEEQDEMEVSLVDKFGLTPFHVLFSTAEPSGKLLKVLLDNYPYYVLGWKNANDKLAMDYLVTNWTETTASLLQMALQSWMFSRLERWGATSWMNAMQSKVQATLEEDDKERRLTLWTEAKSSFAQYETMAAPSILEMALWKREIESGRSNNGAKRQALDRGECRCVCGSNVVIPEVIQFLDIVGPD
eukprot:CAMPEP_0113642524 /NCGR_PEP_ID=MMETSP0017_2-20120614/22342_1 /TAXON_ID=2856 /ORGANISM="Cylindrotheca closterium" /LENGTH=363 /DNA_ID=CAMNT_0000553957 /DNA_START=272 /DNA_END=1363 /DNA_ORIENTATION=- /assembly_acc=CAM_ASM_000147